MLDSGASLTNLSFPSGILSQNLTGQPFIPVFFITVAWGMWRYFAWTNQAVAIFALSMITVYLAIHNKNYWVGLLPGMFYAFVIFSYIFHAPIGFGLEARIGSMKISSSRKDEI